MSLHLKRTHSDKQHAALFRGEPDKISKQKDLDFETEALIMCLHCVQLLVHDGEVLPCRRDLYFELGRTLTTNNGNVVAEGLAHDHKADFLGRFEYQFLDERGEGGILIIEQFLKNGLTLSISAAMELGRSMHI